MPDMRHYVYCLVLASAKNTRLRSQRRCERQRVRQREALIFSLVVRHSIIHGLQSAHVQRTSTLQRYY